MALVVDLLLHKLQQFPERDDFFYLSLKKHLSNIKLKLQNGAVGNNDHDHDHDHDVVKKIEDIKITIIQAEKKIDDLYLAIQKSMDWNEKLNQLAEDFGARWSEIRWINIPVPVAQVPVDGAVDLAEQYSGLTIHSKACFLYFGVFPSDNEIPVWKLILLWIAEGFVPKSDGLSLEDSAYDMLNTLVQSGMVHKSQMSLLGKIKTCRIDYAQGQFCLAKAVEEFFFWKINLIVEGDIAQDEEPVFQSKTSMYSRLFNDYYAVGFNPPPPPPPLVHSIGIVLKGIKTVPIPVIPDFQYELVRVFDSHEPINSSFRGSRVRKYIFLKYVAISGTFAELPESVTDLIRLQTLIVETTSPTLDIRADIWKMFALRHVHTRATTKLPSPPLFGKKNGNLLTLSTVSAQSCKNVISSTPNITKLGIRGDLALLFSKFTLKIRKSLDLNELKNLEKLKLLDANNSRAKSLLHRRKIIFPPNLRKLTLENTFLKWTETEVFAKIPQLEVLKLKDRAFMGPEWNMTSNQRFGNLKVLHIGETDLVQWQASKDQNFPCIESIVVKPQTVSAVPSDLLEFLPRGIVQQP